MIPASATGFSPSQMTRLSGQRANCFSSSVVIFSPCFARRTTIFPPPISSASNACMGCPISRRTKLVMSTTGEMERSPDNASRRRIQAGVSPPFTFST